MSDREIFVPIRGRGIERCGREVLKNDLLVITSALAGVAVSFILESQGWQL